MNDSGGNRTYDILPTAQQWAKATESVLESMVSTRPSVALQPAADANLHLFSGWKQTFSISANGWLWIGAPEKAWDDLGRYVLATLGVDDPTTEDVEATCRDLVAQIGSSFAQGLSQTVGQPITCGDPITAQMESADGAVFAVTIDSGLMTFAGRLAFDQELIHALAGLANGTGAASELPDPVASTSLPARVVLGRAIMHLKDVWKLNVGSVIQLDRSVDNPADLLIREQLVARGQVVSVNGAYGIRIVAIGAQRGGGASS